MLDLRARIPLAPLLLAAACQSKDASQWPPVPCGDKTCNEGELCVKPSPY